MNVLVSVDLDVFLRTWLEMELDAGLNQIFTLIICQIDFVQCIGQEAKPGP